MRSAFNQVAVRYLDVDDVNTRKAVLALTECDQTPIVENKQNTVLLSLTNKLYGMIVSKVTQIDFEQIPETRGDIRKLESGPDLLDCCNVIHDLLVEYGEPTTVVDEVLKAYKNIEDRTDIFEKGFKMGIDIIQVTYVQSVFSIVNSISYMISAMIEYIKDPQTGTYKIALDNRGVAKTQDSLIYKMVLRFNESCRKNELENAFNALLKYKVKKFADGGAIAIIAIPVIVGIAMNILPLLREMTFFIFALRTSVADYLELQSVLLEMNAKRIEANKSETVGDRNKVIASQRKLAERFKKLSNKIAIDTTTAEKTAPKELDKEDRRYKMDELEEKEDEKPGYDSSYDKNPSDDDPLF